MAFMHTSFSAMLSVWGWLNLGSNWAGFVTAIFSFTRPLTSKFGNISLYIRWGLGTGEFLSRLLPYPQLSAFPVYLHCRRGGLSSYPCLSPRIRLLLLVPQCAGCCPVPTPVFLYSWVSGVRLLNGPASPSHGSQTALYLWWGFCGTLHSGRRLLMVLI